MKFPRIKSSFQYFLLTTKRLKIYAQLPWGHQCRKFDIYFVHYAYPVSTISLGLTIPFLFCLYLSLGTKCRWWGTMNKPTFQTATFGAWFFLSFRMCCWTLKYDERAISGDINIRKKR